MPVVNCISFRRGSLARICVLLFLYTFPSFATLPSFQLKSIDYQRTGIDVVDQCLQQRTRAQLGHTIDTVAVVALKQQLSKTCLQDKGYPLASIEVPDQNVGDGRLLIRVVMPLLTQLHLRAKPDVPQRVVRQLLKPLLDKPLWLPELQKHLARIEREPAVAALHADIARVQVGQEIQASLTIELVASPKLTAALRVHNQQAASLGGEAASIELAANRVAGRALEWRSNLDLGEGIAGVGLSANWRLSPDWRWHTGASVRRASVVEQPFDELDIKTRVYQLQLGWIYRNDWRANQHWNMSLLLDRQRSNSELLGQPFSFSTSADDGRLDSTALRLRLGWQMLQRPAEPWQRLLTSQLQLNWGFTALGATAHHDPTIADSQFVSGQASLNVRQNLGASSWFGRLRLAAQFANKPLLPLEQVSVGGHASVRGYRENSLVRDRAVWGSIGLGRGFWRDGSGQQRGWVEIFYDWGKASNVQAAFSSRTASRQSDILSSVGVAAEWQPWRDWSFAIAWAQPQRQRFNPQTDLQDYGWHFQLRYQLWPRL